MPLLFIVLAATLVGTYFLGQKFGYRWVVDRVKATYGDATLNVSLDPLSIDGDYVGFDLHIHNLSEKEVAVNWADTQYWQDGSTNGKILFADSPLSVQIGTTPTNDTISSNGMMKRNLVPAAHMKEIEPNRTSMLYPIDGGEIIYEEDITPPPSYSVLDTEEGSDGIIRISGGGGKHPPRGTPAPTRRTRRTVRRSPSLVVGSTKENSKKLVAGVLPEGAHGIILSLIRDQGPQKIALSFDLRHVRKNQNPSDVVSGIKRHFEPNGVVDVAPANSCLTVPGTTVKKEEATSSLPIVDNGGVQ